MRKLCEQLGIKASDKLLSDSIEKSFAETQECVGVYRKELSRKQATMMIDTHAERVATLQWQCPFTSDSWLSEFKNEVSTGGLQLAEAPTGALEMKVTMKKGVGFYINAACSFLRGVEAKPADGEKEAVEAKEAVEHLRISGLGEAVGVAATAATKVVAAGLGTIIRIQTDYPAMEEPHPLKLFTNFGALPPPWID